MKKAPGLVLRGIWAALATAFFASWISDDTLKFTNSLFSVLFFAGVFLLLQEESKRETSRRRIVFTHAAGLVFSALTSWGYALDASGSVNPLRQLPAILVFAHVLAALVSLVWRGLERTDRADRPEKGFLGRHSWIIPVILLVCWTPAFLADYPGGFRYDATM